MSYRRVEVRQQNDLLTAEQKARMFGTKCDPAEDVTRQEFKAQCETRTILERYGGAVSFQPRQPYYGEVDFDMNLQEAIHAMRTAEEGFRRLPPEIQARYQGWGALAEALARGEVTVPGAAAGSSAAAAGTGGGGGGTTPATS